MTLGCKDKGIKKLKFVARTLLDKLSWRDIRFFSGYSVLCTPPFYQRPKVAIFFLEKGMEYICLYTLHKGSLTLNIISDYVDNCFKNGGRNFNDLLFQIFFCFLKNFVVCSLVHV